MASLGAIFSTAHISLCDVSMRTNNQHLIALVASSRGQNTTKVAPATERIIDCLV